MCLAKRGLLPTRTPLVDVVVAVAVAVAAKGGARGRKGAEAVVAVQKRLPRNVLLKVVTRNLELTRSSASHTTKMQRL